MSIAIFTDLHFNHDDLPVLKLTTDWLLSELEKCRFLRHIFILGDTLHHRSQFDVIAQAHVEKFFAALKALPQAPVLHVLIGNHDMLDLHSREITNLNAFSSMVNLYPEIKEIELPMGGGLVPVLMLPFHQDQRVIRDYLSAYVGSRSPEYVSQTLVMGHLTIDGARANRFDSISSIPSSGSSLSPGDFAPFKRTFSGHFHSFHELAHRVVYVGAPRQIHFGDCDDAKRGFVLYSPSNDHFDHVVNPAAGLFIKRSLKDLAAALRDPEEAKLEYDGKSLYLTGITEADVANNYPQKLLEQLKQAGCKITACKLNILREDEKESKEAVVPNSSSLPEMFNSYLAQFYPRSADAEAVKAAFLPLLQPGSTDLRIRSSFDGRIRTMCIENFLGIRNALVIDFAALSSGLYFLEGENGVGKSTLAEAFVWCLFGSFLRPESVVADAANDFMKDRDEVRVSVTFLNGYQVDRCRSGAKTSLQIKDPLGKILQKGTVASAGKELETLLGIDFALFRQTSILSSASTSNFLNITGAQQREIIETMCGLQVFDALEQLVKTESQNASSKLSAAQVGLSLLDNELRCLEAQFLSPLRQWDEKIRNYTPPPDEEEIKFASENLTGSKEDMKLELETRFAQYENWIDLSDQMQKLQVVREMLKISANRTTLQKLLESTLSLHSRLVTELPAGETRDLVQAQTSALASFYEEKFGPEARRAEEKLAAIDLQIVALLSSLSEVPGPLDLHRLRRACEDDLERLAASNVKSHIFLDRLKILREEHLLTFPREEYDRRVMLIAEDQAKLRARANDLDNARRIWVLAAGMVSKKNGDSFRAFCIKNHVIALNRVMRDCLRILSQGSRVQKSLDCQLKFTNLRLEPCGSGISMGKRSEGQLRRTHLALFLALFVLSRDRLAFKTGFVFFDEPFIGLDESGRRAFVKWLETYFADTVGDSPILFLTGANSTQAHRVIRCDFDLLLQSSIYEFPPCPLIFKVAEEKAVIPPPKASTKRSRTKMIH